MIISEMWVAQVIFNSNFKLMLVASKFQILTNIQRNLLFTAKAHKD